MNADISNVDNYVLSSLQKIFSLKNTINLSLNKLHSDGGEIGDNSTWQSDTTVINNDADNVGNVENKKPAIDVDGVEVHDNVSVIYIPSDTNDELDVEDTELDIASPNKNDSIFQPIVGSTPILKRKNLTDKTQNATKKFKPMIDTIIEVDDDDDDANASKTLVNDPSDSLNANVSAVITQVINKAKKSSNLDGANILQASLWENAGLGNHNNCLCHQYIKELAELAKIIKDMVNAPQEFFKKLDHGKEKIAAGKGHTEKNTNLNNEKSANTEKPKEKEPEKTSASKANTASKTKEKEKYAEKPVASSKPSAGKPGKEKETEKGRSAASKSENTSSKNATSKPSTTTKSASAQQSSKKSTGNNDANVSVYEDAYSFLYDNVYCEQKFSFRGLRPIVIDGSNIAMAHGNGRFSVRGLRICIDFFLRRGHSVYAFIPQYRLKRNKSDNQKALISLVEKQLVFCTSSYEIAGRRYNCYDDRILLQVAGMMKAVVVSRDNYRDLVAEDPSFSTILKNGLLVPTFVGDMFIIPKDPLGPYGPHLNDFLYFPRR